MENFRTHTGEAVTGERLNQAFHAVADFWENNAHAVYAEDGYGSHVSEKTKRDCLKRQLEQSKRIRVGTEPMGFWLWQRICATCWRIKCGYRLPLRLNWICRTLSRRAAYDYRHKDSA